jgi:hypothetical protein
MGLTSKESGYDSQQGQETAVCSIQTGSGAHPASCPMRTRGFSLGVKWLGCMFIVWCLIKHRDIALTHMRCWRKAFDIHPASGVGGFLTASILYLNTCHSMAFAALICINSWPVLPSRLVQWVDALDSSLGGVLVQMLAGTPTICPDCGFPWFPSVALGKCCTLARLAHTFLPYPYCVV